MNIRPVLLTILMTIGPATAGTGGPAMAEPVNTNADRSGPSIAGVRVHLFRNKSATLSDDVLLRDQQDLANTAAGPESTNAALVVVEVAGPPGGTFTGFFGPKTHFRVRLLAQEQGRKPSRLLDQTQTIPVLDDKGRVFLGFWLMPSGCAPVVLTATIAELPSAKPMQKTLDYACGE